MIIAGIDFSQTAAFAVGEARALSDQMGVTLQLVHVLQVHRGAEWDPSAEERIWLRASRVEQSEIAVRRGTPWVELVRTAGECGARLIVVGTHGSSGFQPVALGSTAERLALLSPLPILLVGSRERTEDGAVAIGRSGSQPIHG